VQHGISCPGRGASTIAREDARERAYGAALQTRDRIKRRV